MIREPKIPTDDAERQRILDERLASESAGMLIEYPAGSGQFLLFDEYAELKRRQKSGAPKVAASG